MALIVCVDCGKSISDRAISCPSCGCPVSYMKEPSTSFLDLEKECKEDLWMLAYKMQYKSSRKDVPLAMKIYNYITKKFPESQEAKYAVAQLQIIEESGAVPPNEPTKPTKLCPLCAEVILETAVKCKHCLSILNDCGITKASNGIKHKCIYCGTSISAESSACAECALRYQD